MHEKWTLRNLCNLLLVTGVVTCTPIESYGALQNSQHNHGVVSGIVWRGDQGNVPIRREVRDLKDNFPDQWNLYLLGMAAFQSTTQTDPFSYYSLAGIHGRPFRTWGDAPGIAHKIGTAGYCPHGNPLFLGWHRPYLALVEKLHKHVENIASSAPATEAARYAAAAQSFRMPYWDWARGESGGTVPSFFTTPTIDITRPNGAKDSIPNPLYSYTFHPLEPSDFDGKWRNFNTTLRWPTSSTLTAISDQTRFLKSFDSQRRNLHDTIDAAFRRSTLNAFASTLEDTHGWVHGIIGGGWDAKSEPGHMWPLDYSAYEPLFMAHHTNVDRLFAMYQAAHPDRFFSPQNVGTNGNVFIEEGANVDADTELLPFRAPDGGFWTSRKVMDTRVLGYVYPETANVSTAEEGAKVAAGMYGSSVRERLGAEQFGEVMSANKTFTDWTIRVEAKLAGTFVVRFTLVGDFSSDELVDVGSWVKMRPMSGAGMGEEWVSGSVSLSSSLLDQVEAGRLGSLDKADVVPYLKDKLTWDVFKGDGTKLLKSELGALRVEVVGAEAKVPDGDVQGIEYFGQVVEYPEVTIGKAGGVAI